MSRSQMTIAESFFKNLEIRRYKLYDIQAFAATTDAIELYKNKYYFYIVYQDESWLEIGHKDIRIDHGKDWKPNICDKKIELKIMCFDCMYQGPIFVACDAHKERIK